jgi:hypothetical protein
MRELVNCKRLECEHYRRYNGLQKTFGGAFIPDFVTMDERCSHPDCIKKQPRSLDDPGGVRLIILNECPNGKENKTNKETI